MDYLYLLWYVLALIIAGWILLFILKMQGPKVIEGIKAGDHELENKLGKRNYKLLNILAWIINGILIFYFLGKCAQNYLKI